MSPQASRLPSPRSICMAGGYKHGFFPAPALYIPAPLLLHPSAVKLRSLLVIALYLGGAPVLCSKCQYVCRGFMSSNEHASTFYQSTDDRSCACHLHKVDW
jgi:hypothetical protein